MTGGFNTREPTNTMRIQQQPQVLEIFTRHNWMGFFEKFIGYDDEVAQEFAHSLTPHNKIHATVLVRGLIIDLIPELISRVTTLPLGIPWRKEDKADNQVTKRKFFLEGEEPTEDKNGVRRDSLPYPSSEVGYQLIKYISCDGRYSVVYGYHFRILEELRFGVETLVHQRLSIPYFLIPLNTEDNQAPHPT